MELLLETQTRQETQEGVWDVMHMNTDIEAAVCWFCSCEGECSPPCFEGLEGIHTRTTGVLLQPSFTTFPFTPAPPGHQTSPCPSLLCNASPLPQDTLHNQLTRPAFSHWSPTHAPPAPATTPPYTCQPYIPCNQHGNPSLAHFLLPARQSAIRSSKTGGGMLRACCCWRQW